MPGVAWWSVGAAAVMPPKEGLPVVSRLVAGIGGLSRTACRPRWGQCVSVHTAAVVLKPHGTSPGV
jgi:hypothetical protein